MRTEPFFPASPAELRDRLMAAQGPELLVGFWKVRTGRPTVSWPEAVDEALCVGWIDGVRRRLDDDSYVIRFSPRKTSSTWSTVNIARMGELEAAGRVQPAGRAAFAARRGDRSGIYAYERPDASELPEVGIAALQAEPGAWEFWQSQPPSYRRTATWWVVSAKREATRATRMAELVADCTAGLRIKRLRR